MADKVIVTAAITGNIHTPTMSPYLPITPEQIADEAVRCYNEGCSVAHIHMRKPETGEPVASVELTRKACQLIKQRCDMVVNVTTGGLTMDVESRVKPVLELGLEFASLNAGSMNYGFFPLLKQYKEFKYDWEKPYIERSWDTIFPNTFGTMKKYIEYFRQVNCKPEFETYDLGMISNMAFMVNNGYVDKPVDIQFVLGILGGAPATVENLALFARTAKELLGNDTTWAVCAAGRHQFPMCTTALLLGGNVRVGMEDNLYMEKGVLAKSNAEQVAKIVRIARELGREPATPAETRKMLGLKGLENVKY